MSKKSPKHKNDNEINVFKTPVKEKTRFGYEKINPLYDDLGFEDQFNFSNVNNNKNKHQNQQNNHNPEK